MSVHTLSVLVENRPGVLSRVAGLFSRRGFNITSLAVGETEAKHVSRMTIVVDAADGALEQVTKQLNKLVHVLKIVELVEGSAVERELTFLKVAATAETRRQVLDVGEIFGCRVVDVDLDAVVLEATGEPEKIRALVAVLAPFGLRELVRSGMIGIGRGSKSITEGRALRLERSA